MMDFFQKKIKTVYRANFLITIIVLSIVSLLPIIKTYGRLDIGHDTFVPLIPELSYKMAYQWMDTANGSYLNNNYLVWIPLFHFFTAFGLNIYQAAFIFQFLIYLLSGLGIYKIFNLFNKGNRLFALLPAIVFILSPYQFDHIIYYQGTVGIVWAIYFIFKFIKQKKFTFLDIIFLSIAFGIITDLPNPKYHFILFIIAIVTISLTLAIDLISFKVIKSNIKNFILLLFSSIYLSLPLLFFANSFLSTSGRIFVKAGYKEVGETLDYSYALLSRMVRLFHTPNLNTNDAVLINTPLFFIAYYFIPILVFGIFPIIFKSLDKFSKKIYLIFYILALFLIFLSKSSNPPFGFIYDLLLINVNAFAFMRTSAGIVIFAAVFFALIYGKIFQVIVEDNKIKRESKRLFLISLILVILITGYPIWSGHYFLSRSTVNKYIDRTKSGIIIPAEYFQSSEFLRTLRLDTKIDIYPYASGYQNTTWGYFGFLIYPWIINQPSITFNKDTSEGKIMSNTNSRYIFYDKTLGREKPIELLWHKPEVLIFSSNNVDIYRKYDTYFIPHFYSTRSFIISSKITDVLLKKIAEDGIAIVNSKKKISNMLQQKAITKNPIIEYKKIDPTKYRVIIHKADNPFVLVFTENFHSLWNLYLEKNNNVPINRNILTNQARTYYKVFGNNEHDQASQSELREFINQGSISTLGSLKNRERDYFISNGFTKSIDYTEKYRIDFISKNFKGTIQNDNLPNGTLFETLFFKSLNQPHSQVNGYANGWILDPSLFCQRKENIGKCAQNADGSYDFELIIEFWPQKLAYLSYTISIGVVTILLVLSLYHRIVSRKPSLRE